MFYRIKMMFHQIIWCTCVLLFFGSIVYKGVECSLLLKPQNVAVLSGENVTLQCASTESRNIAWGISSFNGFIYSGSLSQNLYGYHVSEKDEGSSVLSFAASVTTANRYFCIDGLSHENESAELIVLGKPIECNFQDHDDSVILRCSIEYAGNWAPVVECKQYNGKTIEVLQGYKTGIKGNESTATAEIWTFHTKNKLREIVCSTEFKQNEKPKETNATNIPKFFSDNSLRVYQYRSARVPRCSPSADPPTPRIPDNPITPIIYLFIGLFIAAIVVLSLFYCHVSPLMGNRFHHLVDAAIIVCIGFCLRQIHGFLEAPIRRRLLDPTRRRLEEIIGLVEKALAEEPTDPEHPPDRDGDNAA